jgi:hypothetical protein
MELVHLRLEQAALADLDDLDTERGTLRIVVSCSDATTVVAVAAHADHLDGPIGVWLEVDDGYPAQLCARDVATLSWLVHLDVVVVAAASLASQHAQVVEALLSDDEVTIHNDVANVVGAYNRPAPPRPVEVWSFDGTELRLGTRALRALATVPRRGGLATTYA